MMEKRGGIKMPKTVLCCLLAALLLPAMFISSKIIDRELMSYIKQTLDELSEQNVNTIQDTVRYDLMILEEISDRVRFDESIDSISAGMKSAAEYYGYKRMEIVYRDGTVYASDDKEHDILGDDHVQLAFEKVSNISDPHPDSGDGELILAYSVPVYDREEVEVIAVLVAISDLEGIREHLSVSAFGGKEYAYIVKTDGTLVVDSDNPSAYKGMENVFIAMEKVGSNAKVAGQMKSDLGAGRENCLPYRNNGELRYINYAPLGINDWYLLSVVSGDVTNASRFKIMVVMDVINVLVVVVSLIFVAAMIRGEKHKQAELNRILYRDELTGGMSYAKFCIDAAERLEKRLDKSEKAACIMTDLENFRLINNLYGKSEGDKTIRNSYRAFQRAVGANDLVARLAADKFYALIFFRNREELDRKLNDYIDELKKSDDITENEYILNPSIGVYIADTPGEDIATITNNATIAHDSIVGQGGRIVFYDERHRDTLKMNKTLQDKMELAHQNHEFIPYFQPKYDTVTGKICGAEALVRWRNPDGSITMPGKFIPLAESNGFIRVLDRDIFNAVCAFQQKMLESGGTCVPISVNVSRQLMYEQNFAADYIETLKQYHLSPELVELEITESVLFDDYGVFREIINKLRESGFKILMDDFGTGYSSLMMLGSVPIDNLKLDKSFIDSFEEEKGRKIIMCVIELAKSLSLPLTAEGVETRGQFDFLKSMGCNIIQGYFFSKPVPEETFREMLAAN